MSEEAREVKALALLNYYERKQEFAVLSEKVKQSGELLINAGNDLKTDPALYIWKKYTIVPSEIDDLLREWQALNDQTEELRKKAASFGLAV